MAALTNEQLAAAGYASATLEDLRTHAKTAEFAASMKRLKATREEDIDYTEIPPISDARLAAMVRADQYRPVKRTVTIRFDADVLDWLKSKGGRYQTKLNAMLRGQMLREAER